MTVQRKDTIIFNGKEYILFDSEQGKLLYNSFNSKEDFCKKYEAGICSGLWRGHYEEYEIINNQLWGRMNAFVYDDDDNNELITSDLEEVAYTGSCVIGNRVRFGDFLHAYLECDEAYKLHFTDGRLDECLSLQEALDFYNCYSNENSLLREYGKAIALHFVKYKYDPFHSLYWRYPENDMFTDITDDERAKRRKEYEARFQELLLKL